MGYKQHDTDDPRQKWEEFAAMHVTPVRCHCSPASELLDIRSPLYRVIARQLAGRLLLKFCWQRPAICCGSPLGAKLARQ